VCEAQAACAGPPISPAYTMSEQRSMQRSLRVGKPVPVALCALGYVKRRPGKSAPRRGGVSAAERRVCVQCDDLEPLSSFAPSEMRNHVNTLGPLHGMLSWVPRAEGSGFNSGFQSRSALCACSATDRLFAVRHLDQA
jgi:hypothetical protein